ncbi:MAG: hypothetical protein R3346_00225 [Candidatus Spechtbacterales bacterium]|nr:hypothetical protein [Candidatus Spechtbacterales bacterium]
MKKLSLLLFLLIVAASSLLIYELTDDLSLTLMVGVDLFVAVSVLSFAFVQISLNRHLIELQDYVALSLVTREGGLSFFNTGKLNVYIHKIEIKDKESEEIISSTAVFEKARLIPSGTLEESYYWYPLTEEIFKHDAFTVSIYLNDELDRKWLSEHGGDVLDNKELRVWSHKTSQKNWSL